jgi:hypothetical protein
MDWSEEHRQVMGSYPALLEFEKVIDGELFFGALVFLRIKTGEDCLVV